MIIKSYEVQKNKSNLSKYNFFLLYGENFGLKKDIKNFITSELKQKNDSLEISSLYESEILDNEENFFNLIYSGSLFSQKKIVNIYESTDKIVKKINIPNLDSSMIKFISWFSRYNLVPLGMSLKMCLLNKDVVEKDFNKEFDKFTFKKIKNKFNN